MEKLYPESAVKELLRKHKRLIIEDIFLKHNQNLEYLITDTPSPALEGGIEIHDKFIAFLDTEHELGISDKKTIERIKWYFNTYFTPKEEQK